MAATHPRQEKMRHYMAFHYTQWLRTTSEHIANFKLGCLLHRRHVRSDAHSIWSRVCLPQADTVSAMATKACIMSP